jgi:4,5-dihydroxyphthalate decarboxylase
MTTAVELEVPIPTMRYDITIPLLDGRVTIDGVKLTPSKISGMVFGDHPQLREGNFGLCDLNLGYFLPAIEAGWELIGLPIFCKRKPVYPLIFCRADAGIGTPKDLQGRRIGTRMNRTAVPIWCRGLLQHRHGVDISTLRWVVPTQDPFPFHGDAGRIEQPADPKKDSVDQLLDGDVDAIMTDISDVKLFETLESSPKVKRLFPSYMETEMTAHARRWPTSTSKRHLARAADTDERLYRETGIYTPMHQMVMSSKLDREHPELAAKLFEAFEQAKAIAYRDILSDQAGFSVVYLRERMKEQQERWGDPFKYGLSANKSTIDAFVAYNVEQGMIRAAPSPEQIYAAGTLAT